MKAIVLSEYRKSRFFSRLDEFPNGTAIDELKTTIGKVAECSAYLLAQINRAMHQYTKHDQTHILNVLALMEMLTPEKVMEGLSPLECALPILAAYTHDLGMVLSEEEYREIIGEKGDTPKRMAYLQHRTRFGEEVRQIERLKSGDESEKARAELIEARIRADYIRVTHIDADVDRARHWLKEIKGAGHANNEALFTYQGYDYLGDLVKIGLSHGAGVRWLREKLVGTARANQFVRCIGGEDVNFAFPGLLLRLADIMDFDATRAPMILFRHMGIEDRISVKEWKKHLAITGWKFDEDRTGLTLTYAAHQCTDPVTEKTIRDFVRQIDEEVRAVREELAEQTQVLGKQGERYELRLPFKVEADIQAAEIDGRPSYIYRDIQFRLDQDEIQQILMGEALYGDPSLCIRELLQNALDAVELRDVRLQFQDSTDKDSGEPVDRLKKGEELKVDLTWGRDDTSGQEWLRVTDNGVGMTREVIERYFTQIGKSFYRSHDYRREQATLASQSLVTSPISHFGIGILSCFMIADRLRVRTCPGGDREKRPPFDVIISGPGSLFWLEPGTLERQGTEVTLYLKPRFRIEHDDAKFWPGLRSYFDYIRGERYSPKDGVIDPAFCAASCVVWPRYQVVIHRPGKMMPIRIDDRFHVETLAPIGIENEDTLAVEDTLLRRAVKWGFAPSQVGKPVWGTWDWTDDGEGGTLRR